jgi:flagellar basal-body rod modification protein FlgD
VVDSVSSNSFVDSIKWPETSTPIEDEPSNQRLTQEDFFALLTQQLAYQDPFKPVENAEMVSQMTGFTTAEGVNEMNEQFGSLNELMGSSQALQASGLVGQKVLVPINTGSKDALGGIEGMASLDKATHSMKLIIKNEAGATVATRSLGPQEKGNARFLWDGNDNNGNPLPPGQYSVDVETNVDGEMVSQPVSIYAKVESVNLGGGQYGVVLNLNGLGGFKLSDVLEVAGG